MSQKFVMLFLVSKTKIVTLDVAAKILIEESQDTPDHSKFKSKHLHLNPLSSTERVGFHMLMFAVLEIIFFLIILLRCALLLAFFKFLGAVKGKLITY